MLRSNKTVFLRQSNTLEPYAWLGPRSGIGGIKRKRGKLDVEYRRATQWTDFQSMLRNIKSPGGTTLPLYAKERLCAQLYDVDGDWDIDVRTKQNGRLRSDPNGWNVIKRICTCLVEKEDTDREVPMEYGDEGETLVTLDVESPHSPVIIYRVDEQEYKLYLYYNQFFDMASIPAITVRNDCELVLTSGDEDTGYGVGYGEDHRDLAFGLQTIGQSLVDVSADDRIVVTVASNGRVYYSITSGYGFAQSSGVTDALVVALYSYSTCWVGGENGNVYKASDGGRTFSVVTTHGAVTGDIIGFAKSSYDTFVLDANGYLAVLERDTFYRVEQVALDNPTDILWADGILYVAGYDSSGQPQILGSIDNGYNWTTLLTITGEHNLGTGFDYQPLVKLASCGCGVVWASFIYSTGTGASAQAHSAVYRSVDFGVDNWEVQWSDSATIADSSDVIFLPFDVVCCGPNKAWVVGAYWDRTYNILYYLSEEYRPGLLVFDQSCIECL